LTDSYESWELQKNISKRPLPRWCMQAHTVKMLKVYWKYMREGDKRPNDYHEKREDTDDESDDTGTELTQNKLSCFP
jgi:hypothetical protein